MLEIPEQYTSLEFIKDIAWPEIFSTWRNMEASQESWQKHWEERGYTSWDEWREAYAAPLKPGTLEWFLFCFKDPLKDFPLMYGVPSRSWVDKAYDGKTTKMLKDILNLPIISENPKVHDIKKDFPSETMLTGIIFQNNIVIVEGMHRACALAEWDPNTPFMGKVNLASAEWNEKEIPIIGGNYKK